MNRAIRFWRDELARQRRELPWVPVDKEYTLQTEYGPKTLTELFDGRSQLMVYHFMFGPDWTAGCPTCSSMADSFNGAASGVDIVRYFSEQPGVNVFGREGDTVYHCYSSSRRGVEFLMGYYPILDRVPKGRDESDGHTGCTATTSTRASDPGQTRERCR